MIVQLEGYLLPVTKALTTLLQQTIDETKIDTSNGAVINFRDPSYSATSGGYHPVEIALNYQGKILYITDFCYYGSPPFQSLEKEIDFDFYMNSFQHMDRHYPLAAGRELYRIWEQNFCSYLQSGVYQVSVGAL